MYKWALLTPSFQMNDVDASTRATQAAEMSLLQERSENSSLVAQLQGEVLRLQKQAETARSNHLVFRGWRVCDDVLTHSYM